VAPFRFQLDDDAVAVVADGLIVREQRARVARAFVQDVVPEEPRAVAEPSTPRIVGPTSICDAIVSTRPGANVPGRIDDEGMW